MPDGAYIAVLAKFFKLSKNRCAKAQAERDFILYKESLFVS